MNVITRQDILAHQTEVPWPLIYQVEQDLLLCQAMVALFNDPFLKSQIAMRGGTVLHKVHLPPASRYSEDIDLVAIGDRPEEHIRAAIKRVLQPVLGTHKRWGWESLKLAVRNAAKPSRILRVVYERPSIAEPGRTLSVVIEANVTERQPYLPVVAMPFSVPFRGKMLATHVNSFDLPEMLGTKLRALFQRRRGRDLFDLYWAFSTAGGSLSPEHVIDAFQHYMALEGSTVPRNEFLEQLDIRLADRGFCSDMGPLLRNDLSYDPQAAGVHIRNNLLAHLPP
ncbi:MAG: nucleotidyl transferase AbiEii/AbiGii toxin family protein [Pseudomonadota bacterium]|nr:nucleotidyl transferase AbiEii/AbiGii toxin family protein [Pseudomonadota bacterium]